jgi:MFS family permease
MGSNVGLLVGAVLGERIPHICGHGKAALMATVCVSLGMLLIPWAAGPVPVVVAVSVLARFLYGLGDLLFFVQHISIRQGATPEDLQGRMNATIRFLGGGTYPIGALCGELLANYWHTQSILVLAGRLCCLNWVGVG